MDGQHGYGFFNHSWFDQTLGALAQDPSNNKEGSEETDTSHFPVSNLSLFFIEGNI